MTCAIDAEISRACALTFSLRRPVLVR